MSVNLYRLFAIQNFNNEKVAVYVNEGNFPDPEVLNDAEDISRGTITRKELFKRKPWLYENKLGLNRKNLTYYTRLLTRSRAIIEGSSNVDKAIFVETTDKRDWRGERTLYHNKYFDEVKSDTPQYSGCEPKGTIKL